MGRAAAGSGDCRACAGPGFIEIVFFHEQIVPLGRSASLLVKDAIKQAQSGALSSAHGIQKSFRADISQCWGTAKAPLPLLGRANQVIE